MRTMIATAGFLVLMAGCAPGPIEPVGTAATETPAAQQVAPAAPEIAAPQVTRFAPGTEPLTAEAQTACDARNGEMRRVGMLGTWQCIVRYTDAGKRCTDSDQCEGDCRAEVNLPSPSGASVPPARTRPPPPPTEGVCQASSNAFGCHAVVENGRAQPMLCVD